MKAILRSLLPCLALLVAPGPAGAVVIRDIEFTDWEVVEITSTVELTVSTDEDLYVFVPERLLADTVFIRASLIVFADTAGVDQNDPTLCDAGCPSESFERSGDVVLEIFAPLGDVELTASRVLFSTHPIPEPAPGLCVGAGLVALAIQERPRRRR